MVNDLAFASPLLIVTLVGLLALMVGVFSPRDRTTGWLAYVVSLGFATALASLWWLWQRAPVDFETPLMAQALVFDHFGLALCGVILVGAILTTLTAVHHLPAQDADHHEYYALVAFATLGMMALVTAGDLLTLFVALEVMSIAIYVLAGFKRQSPYAIEAALKYFVLGSFASALLLLGIAYIYGVTGEIGLEQIGKAFHLEEGVAGDPLAGVGMLLLLAAFAFKIAAAPFHMWTPDVYEGAVSPATGLMAVGVKTAAFGALARVVLTCFGDDVFRTSPLSWELLIAALAVASMFAGNLMALAQKNLKRLLAYSAIAHTGYILLALLVQPEPASGGVAIMALGGGLVFYLLAYTLANAAAFGVAAALGSDDREGVDEAAYAGLAQRDPALALVLAVSMLSLLGIPATAGFMGKLTIFSEVLERGDTFTLWLVVIAVINAVISAWYYLRVILVAYMLEPDASPPAIIQSRPLRWAIGVATALTLVVGLMPGPTLDASIRAGHSLKDTTTPGLAGRDSAHPPIATEVRSAEPPPSSVAGGR